MDKLRAISRWIWSNLGNFALVIGWLVSLGFFPTLLAMGKGASPITYGLAAAAGLLIFALVRTLWNGARLLKSTAKARERLTGASSGFDPMARVFEDKRLFLRDLVPVGRRRLDGRKFLRCEIIGPGNIVVALRANDTDPFPVFKHNWFNDVDMIQIVPGVESKNAIYFFDCDFEGCYFYNVNLLFFERINSDTWWWITPDATQPRLIEGGALSIAEEEGEPS
jgi:hypothetical protein